MPTAYRKRRVKEIFLVVLTLGTFGCATPPSSRVGVLTYEAAVMELGPPDNETTLPDGRRVCQWTTGVNKNWVDKHIMVFGEDGKLVSEEDRRF